MSISAIFPNSTPNQENLLQSTNRQQQTEFQQLTQALQSGDLTNAKQAFTALTNAGVSSGLQSGQVTQGLNTLGSALQSGDLAGARDAYTAIQQNLLTSGSMTAHHHSPHHVRGLSNVLTSGFPDGTSSSGSSAVASAVLKLVNLIA